MSHRTTSATPVSHVFPGRRAEMQAREKMFAAVLRYARAHYVTEGPIACQPPEPPRTPRAPSMPQAAPNHPDCVCAAYGALEGRLRGIDEDLTTFVSLVSTHIRAVAEVLEDIEARLRALEVSGEGERG